MKHLLVFVLTLSALLICTGCGNGGPVGLSEAQIPSNLAGDWVWRIGRGCALLPGFLDPDDGNEIFPVSQNGLRLSANFFDGAGNRVVLDATIDGACVQGTYTITEPDLRNLEGAEVICDTKAYTSSGTPVLAADFGQVQVIDLENNIETSTINFGTPPGRLCGTPDGTLVFVPLMANNSVAVVNTTSDTVVDTITGDAGEMPGPFCCVATNDTLYVGNEFAVVDGGVITVIDIDSGMVVNTIPTVGIDVTDMVLTPDGSELLVAFSDTQTIESFSTATLTATGGDFQIGFEPNSLDISPNGQHLVVVGNDQTMVCATLQGDLVGAIEEGGNDVRITPDSSAFWFTHLPNEMAVLGGTSVRYRIVSGYNLPSLNPIRTYHSTNNIPAFGIDLCGDGTRALTGFSSQQPTFAWDLTSTNEFGRTVGSFSPSEFVYIRPRLQIVIPPPRTIVFQFKFFTAFNPINGNAMLDGFLSEQALLSGAGCQTDSWTEILQDR